ncbi:unnamed protein product [Choristocarpus tenellus]
MFAFHCINQSRRTGNRTRKGWRGRKRMGSRGANPFLKAGMPLLAFIVGGSYVLSQFVSGQVEAKDLRGRSKSIREFNLEEEHRRTMKIFSEDYELRRIPRPDEEGPPK